MVFDDPPHGPLTAYYGEQTRSRYLRQLFDGTAGAYDAVEVLLSLGTGRAWRRAALRRVAPRAGASVLDLATGTGVLAAAAAGAVGPDGVVVALDLSGQMLRRAGRHGGVTPVQASVDALPFGPARFDLLTMGYALRHIGSLSETFAEWARVMRPGGRILLLEIGRPRGRVGRWLARAYLGRVVPALAGLLHGRDTATLMRYYWDTIEACVPPETIVGAMRQAGLSDAACQTSMGFLHSYTASKPE